MVNNPATKPTITMVIAGIYLSTALPIIGADLDTYSLIIFVHIPLISIESSTLLFYSMLLTYYIIFIFILPSI